MGRFIQRVKRLVNGEHSVIDALVFVGSLLLVSLLDLTALPELPGVFVYELMLLLAIGAVAHFAFSHRRKRHLH